MTPQSKIYFKGSNKPITVFYAEAKKVEEAKMNDYIAPETMLKVGNETFAKHTVDRVSVIRDLNEKNPHDDEHKRFYAEEKKQHETAIKDPNRWHSTVFFAVFCQGVGVPLTQDLLLDAQAIQKIFFEKHPRRTLVSPTFYYPIMPEGFKRDILDNGRFADLVRVSALRLLGLAVARDAYLANEQ